MVDDDNCQIKVVVRLRPLLQEEIMQGKQQSRLHVEDADEGKIA